MEINTPADVLDSAADILDEVGWCRGTFEDLRTGHVCARGALMKVPAPSLLVSQAGDALALSVGVRDYGAVSLWNDDSRMTKRKVTSQMRKVAKQLRARQ